MKRLAFLILVVAPWSDAWAADPAPPTISIRLPTAPVVPTPPAPVPSPLTPTVLTQDLLYVIDSDVACLIRTSPVGLVDVAADTGPIKIRGKFVDGSGKSETRTYNGKFVYTLTAAATGKAELLIFPVGATKDSDIISRLLDCQLAPLPPPIPPEPPTPPDPDPFVDAKAGPGLRVMMVYDTKTLGTIPPGQRLVLYSQQIRDYAIAKAVKDADGAASFRCVDSTTDMTNDAAVWQKGIKKAKSLPWLLVGNGKHGYSGPLPSSIDDAMKILQKYGE